MGAQRGKGGKRKPKRSFGHRLKWAAIIGLASGAGAVVLIFVLAWGATEIGVGTIETVGGTADRPAFAEATKVGGLAWKVGAVVGGLTFLKELAD